MVLLPVALYGVEVPPGEIMIPAAVDFPATIRITMAAIDPTEEPEPDEKGDVPRVPRSTLKLIKERMGSNDDDDEDDDSYLQELLANGEDDDSDEDEEDEEANGGPSDPAKSKKARQEAALKQLLKAAQDDDESDEEMADGETNGVKPKKGKEVATEEDEDSDEESDSEDGIDLESHVICTLDVDRHYQQPLDIVIGENERAYFIVTGTHSVHLTGNYVMPPDEEEDSEDDEDEDEYDLTPDLDELIGNEDDVSSDELDEIELAERIAEVDTDEEEAPKLVKAKKGKKRPAEEEEAEGLDDLIAKASKAEEPEAKLSKKQLKKLKNNKGEAVAVEEAAKKETTPSKGDKKVQFAKNLEQGPTGSAEKPKADGKAGLGVKVIQGVTIDDRKLGSGRAAKSGDKVSMRYIGKLKNGKVFDANKKGPPFSFKLGKGEVIKGWDIGVAGMSVGGERRLTIPAALAYGAASMPGIPSNSVLTFDVKLLEIK